MAEYDVSLPGLQDIISVPALDDKALRRERIQRMKANRSALPEGLGWVPRMINKLDDAQDFLSTGLFLLAKLMPRVLGRMLPILGWALLANDILNVVVSLLGVLTSGPRMKTRYFNEIKNLAWDRKSRMKRGIDFLRHPSWKSFLWQAPQVLYNATGYGLKLGAIFGAVSDAAWGLVRMAQGNTVNVVGPPSNDIVMKAARVAQQYGDEWFAGDALSSDDHALLGTAGALSVMTLGDAGRIGPQVPEVFGIGDLRPPFYVPWNPASVEALQEEGIDPFGRQRSCYPGYDAMPTYGNQVAMLWDGRLAYEQSVSSIYGETARGAVQHDLYSSVGSQAWDMVSGAPGTLAPVLSLPELLPGWLIELGVFPPFNSSPVYIMTDEEKANWHHWTGLKPGRFPPYANTKEAWDYFSWITLLGRDYKPVRYFQRRRLPTSQEAFNPLQVGVVMTWGGFGYRPFGG